MSILIAVISSRMMSSNSASCSGVALDLPSSTARSAKFRNSASIACNICSIVSSI